METNQKHYRLSLRILAMVMGGTVLIWLSTAIYSYVKVRHEIQELVKDGLLISKNPASSTGEKSTQLMATNTEEVRRELVEHLVSQILTPAAFGLPILAIWIFISLYIGFSPIRNLSRDIAMRTVDYLEPIYPPKTPEEMRGMLYAINALFQRVKDSIVLERNFSDNAAHEMRTPLSALTAQLQVAQKARNAEEQSRALSQALKGSEQLRHLLEQLLTLSRLQNNDTKEEQINIREMLVSILSELSGAIDEKMIQVNIETTAVDGALIIWQASPTSLRLWLRNALDNAIRYHHHGGNINIGYGGAEKKWWITIADDGNGIPPEEVPRLLQRFTRMAGQDVSGSGLGLSIMDECAKRLSAKMVFIHPTPPIRGLTVRLEC